MASSSSGRTISLKIQNNIGNPLTKLRLQHKPKRLFFRCQSETSAILKPKSDEASRSWIALFVTLPSLRLNINFPPMFASVTAISARGAVKLADDNLSVPRGTSPSRRRVVVSSAVTNVVMFEALSY